MGFNEFMTKLFGNKSQRDLKEITPYVDKIKAVYPSIQKLSNDELRAKTDEIKQRIQDYVADERAKVEELRKGIDNKELEEREAIWAEVDKIEKNITEKMEVVLEEVLPEVFSIMKDTARRFSENETIEVTANDFDRNLATRLGGHATGLIANRQFGRMVCMKGNNVESIALSEVAGKLKLVTPEHDLIVQGERMGISFGK